jgi:hypothetical protein
VRTDPNIAKFRRRRFDRRLAAYVAGLAGFAISEQDAMAGIVYTNLIPNGITVWNSEFEIDLDLDGAVDFQLAHSTSFSSGEAGCTTFSNGTFFCTTGWRTYVFGAAMQGVGANKVVAMPGRNLAQNLSAGAQIRIEDAQQPTALLEHYFYTWSTNSSGRGTFRVGGGGEFGRGYLGFRFDISGSGSHAGWFEVESLGGAGAKVFGFAYETEPGAPIRAGDTGAFHQTSPATPMATESSTSKT